MPGTQGIGMMGTLGSGSQMRPSGMAQHQQRPTQSSLRPASSPSTQPPVTQVCFFDAFCHCTLKNSKSSFLIHLLTTKFALYESVMIIHLISLKFLK